MACYEDFFQSKKTLSNILFFGLGNLKQPEIKKSRKTSPEVALDWPYSLINKTKAGPGHFCLFCADILVDCLKF
jgi:hypothetical protein